MSFKSLQSPGAWIPLVLSLAGLLMVVLHALMSGVAHEVDEGTPAHVFQLLMLAQAPFAIWHLIRFLPIDRGRALGVAGVQAALALAAMIAAWMLT